MPHTAVVGQPAARPAPDPAARHPHPTPATDAARGTPDAAGRAPDAAPAGGASDAAPAGGASDAAPAGGASDAVPTSKTPLPATAAATVPPGTDIDHAPCTKMKDAVKWFIDRLFAASVLGAGVYLSDTVLRGGIYGQHEHQDAPFLCFHQDDSVRNMGPRLGRAHRDRTTRI